MKLARFAAWLPALAPLWLIWRYGVDVPYWDEWYIAPLISGLDGPVSFAALLAPHNEHRILVPRLLFLANAWLTHWNLRAEMFALWVLACATAACAWRLGRRTVGGESLWLAGLLTSVFVFSPIQAESWLFGVQLVVFVPVACTMAGILLASQPSREAPRMAGCAVLAATSLLSMGYGLLTGIVLWLVLAVRPAVRRREKAIGLALFAAFWAAAVVADVRGLSHAPVSAALAHPLAAVKFALICVGAPLAFGGPWPPARTALALGAIETGLLGLAALYVFWRRRALLQTAAPWLALGLFVVGSGALVAAARLDVGMQEALALRYFTIPLLLLVSLVYLIGVVVADAGRTFGRVIAMSLRAGSAGLVATALVLSAYSWRFGFVYARVLAEQRMAAKAALTFVDFVTPGDMLGLSNLPVAELRRQAHALDDAGLLRPRLATRGGPGGVQRRGVGRRHVRQARAGAARRRRIRAPRRLGRSALAIDARGCRADRRERWDGPFDDLRGLADMDRPQRYRRSAGRSDVAAGRMAADDRAGGTAGRRPRHHRVGIRRGGRADVPARRGRRARSLPRDFILTGEAQRARQSLQRFPESCRALQARIRAARQFGGARDRE